MTLVLGLTGGIATGKSTADNFFKKHHIPIVDSDKIAHHIYDPGKQGYNEVVTEFSSAILDSDKKINRKRLGEIVFHNPQKMQRLDEITHPLIYQEVVNKLNKYREQAEKIVIFDAPLLYETGGQRLCDFVLVISLPESLQLKRLMERNNLTESQAQARIDSQMPLAKKIAKADFVVDNTGTIDELEEKLKEILLKVEAEG